MKGNTPVRKEGLRFRLNDAVRVVNLEVFPLRPAGVLDRYFLVTFEDVTQVERPEAAVSPAPKKPAKGKTAKDRQIQDLDNELAATKEYLQAVIEKQETSVEEMKSSNEELMSANEELQSINEEMETSKEELQSSNEELATLNEELDNRNQELTQASNDLNNLLNAVQVAIVMLGPDLRIRRFNPLALEMLNLVPADLGRPIGDLKLRVEVTDLEPVIQEVLEHLVVREQEVRDRGRALVFAAPPAVSHRGQQDRRLGPGPGGRGHPEMHPGGGPGGAGFCPGHHRHRAGAPHRPERRPQDYPRQRGLLRDLQSRTQGDGKQVVIRAGQPPVGHRPAPGTPGRHPARQPAVSGLRSGARFPRGRPPRHAPQRPAPGPG